MGLLFVVAIAHLLIATGVVEPTAAGVLTWVPTLILIWWVVK